MYCVKRINDDLFWVGGTDRRLALFENAYPIPRGVSYNAYLLLDEKTVLFDTVDRAITEQFFENIDALLKGRALDYVVVNHMEPDHCATLGEIVLRYPGVQVVCNPKTIPIIKQFYNFDIDSRAIVVKENDTLCTGRHTFTFLMAPMVHWPEVMVTYDITDKTLFSADAFGTFGAMNGNLFADEVNFERDWLDDARRYYTNIVGKYGPSVQTLLKKASGLDIRTLCPLHGPVWRKDISWYVDKYLTWSSYEPEEKGVMIAYASMYGNTEQMAEAIAAELSAQGIRNIVMHNVSKSNPSYIIADIFKYRGLIIGSPTYSNQIYPEIESLLSKILVREVKGRYLGYFGSFCWAGAAVKRMGEFAEKSKFEIVGDPLNF